jgi:hypothetical protein
LFGVGEIPKQISREALLATSRVSSGSSTWRVTTESGSLTLKPFASIGDEIYRLYHQVKA